ncbi:DinB family protein [Marinobacter sp. TBZ242]|uniref:DinB family protein n=1 Tax=Marinobacter azerbaijanicus TaxID=3050455 RepID=A0ABT7II04_9GAMM|nr:DinB family protein [Marinobacter sp. TBZ242]MDL0432783.1 DinB family protein [Marinobacter sp. TBZ242]
MPNSSAGSVSCEELVAENAHAINQLAELLVVMPGQLYRRTFGAKKQHVIGKHVRHIIDHYMALLKAVNGRTAGPLDYEKRQREENLELDNHAACNRLLAIINSLGHLTDRPPNTPLAMEHLSDDQRRAVTTSIDRELVFLASHTIHHMAIIAMLAEQGGVEVRDGFGVHPSTLRHQQQLQMQMARTA